MEKMTDIMLFWASKGVDGFRCDMAEMIPVEFWNYAVNIVKKALSGSYIYWRNIQSS